MSSRLIPPSKNPQHPLQTQNQRPLGIKPWNRTPSYPKERNPFRCSHCGGPNTLRAFPTVYGNGSSISRYRKGLILKTGWAETRRQSVLAEKCSPPNKRRLFWRVSFLLVSFASLLFGKGTHIPFISFPFDFSEIGAASALVAVFLVVDAVRWNILKYPLRFEQWQNSYWCVRCSRVSIIERVD
jgi:hypothetical protein